MEIITQHISCEENRLADLLSRVQTGNDVKQRFLYEIGFIAHEVKVDGNMFEFITANW